MMAHGQRFRRPCPGQATALAPVTWPEALLERRQSEASIPPAVTALFLPPHGLLGNGSPSGGKESGLKPGKCACAKTKGLAISR